VQIVTLVAMHLGKRFTHAVIAAPQEQIEQVLSSAITRSSPSPSAPGSRSLPFKCRNRRSWERATARSAP
jgi:hypothetical protein